MIAKYKGRCAACGEPITPGQSIKSRGGGWAHMACGPTSHPCEERDIESVWQDQQDDLWEAEDLAPRDGLEGCSSVGELMAQDMRRARMRSG